MVFIGNASPYHVTQQSTVQIVSPTATMASVKCSLDAAIPSSMTVTWLHNGSSVMTMHTMQSNNIATLQINNLQPSDAGVYQCVFNDAATGWILRRKINLLILSMQVIV